MVNLSDAGFGPGWLQSKQVDEELVGRVRPLGRRCLLALDMVCVYNIYRELYFYMYICRTVYIYNRYMYVELYL